MEAVLDVYEQGYDPQHPVFALDESPKHGSWLNIAEYELNVLTRQGLRRRVPDRNTLQQQVTAWYRQRNRNQPSVNWQFTTKDARIKLKRLYPSI